MVIKVRQLLLRLGIVLAFVILFAGIFLLLPDKNAPAGEIILADETARTAWLALRGWQTGIPEAVPAVMPAEWQTDAGQQWLSVQRSQGLSPESCAGKEITRYIYPILDEDFSEYCAELWLCGDVLTGAVIYDAETQQIRPVISQAYHRSVPASP
jgi:hypothetical protein